MLMLPLSAQAVEAPEDCFKKRIEKSSVVEKRGFVCRFPLRDEKD